MYIKLLTDPSGKETGNEKHTVPRNEYKLEETKEGRSQIKGKSADQQNVERERLRKQMRMRWKSQNKKNKKKKCGREIVYKVGNK